MERKSRKPYKSRVGINDVKREQNSAFRNRWSNITFIRGGGMVYGLKYRPLLQGPIYCIGKYPPLGGGILADVIWGKKYEKAKRKRGKRQSEKGGKCRRKRKKGERKRKKGERK